MKVLENKQLHHLGIVAGVCNEIGLIEEIDCRISKPKRKVSVGHAVQTMIVNALGFTGRALYLTPRFMDHKPVDVLIGEGVRAEDLHDDCLGTALDALFHCGLTELFYEVASGALRRYGIDHRFVHLDTTTFSLHGAYDEEDESAEVVSVTKGYSKDANPQLNQVVVSLMCTYRSSIPVWIETLSGNSSDKVSLRKSIGEYRSQFQAKRLPYFVADSALYSRENLEQLSQIKWVTRVPETLKEARSRIAESKGEEMEEIAEGYRVRSVCSSYGGITQRWLIVFSEKGYQREVVTLEKNIDKERENKEKALWHLSNQPFACEADARAEAERFVKALNYHTVSWRMEKRDRYGSRGRPAAGTEPAETCWFIVGTLGEDEEAIREAKSRKGMFIIATNELDEEKLSNAQLLDVYKAQGVSVERGFRFLKDPMFYAESLYLNSPRRIMALIMVMGLSLLVYALAERKIRKALKERGASINNQVNKPTQTPTIRWVFQLFEGILILTVQEGERITRMTMNVEEDHRTILRCLGRPYEKIYFL
jgi:transposase